METQREYVIVVNGRPFFSVVNEDLISGMEDEAVARFGATAKIEIFVQTTEPYATAKGDGK